MDGRGGDDKGDRVEVKGELYDTPDRRMTGLPGGPSLSQANFQAPTDDRHVDQGGADGEAEGVYPVHNDPAVASDPTGAPGGKPASEAAVGTGKIDAVKAAVEADKQS